MNITMAMLWDGLSRCYPTLETGLYGGQTVRGIKLLAEGDPADAPDQLYLARSEADVSLRCGGQESLLWDGPPLEELFNALLDNYNRLRDWDMGTHLALIEGGSIQALLDLSQPVLGNPVTVTDPSFKLLAHAAGQGAAASPVFLELRRRGYLPAETVRFYHQHGHLNQLAHTDSEAAMRSELGYIIIIRPLLVDGQIMGYLSMPCVQTLYSEGIADCFRYLAHGLEHRMAQELQSSAVHRHIYEYLLMDLIQGKPMTPEAVQERLRYIDLPIKGPSRLLWLVGGEQETVLSSYLARQAADLLPNARVLPYQEGALVLVPEERLQWTLDALEPLLLAQSLHCGVSRPFSALTDLRAAYQEAEAALRLGRRVSENQTLRRLGVEELRYGGPVFRYERYAAHHMVEHAAQAGRISPALRQVIEADRREGTDHLRLLHGYLLCERRPTQTAAYLHMHRNNVIYRVGRLEELFGIRLDDSALRGELALSLLAAELTEISRL